MFGTVIVLKTPPGTIAWKVVDWGIWSWYGAFGLYPLEVLLFVILFIENVWFKSLGDVWRRDKLVSGKFPFTNDEAYYYLTVPNLPIVCKVVYKLTYWFPPFHNILLPLTTDPFAHTTWVLSTVVDSSIIIGFTFAEFPLPDTKGIVPGDLSPGTLFSIVHWPELYTISPVVWGWVYQGVWEDILLYPNP